MTASLARAQSDLVGDVFAERYRIESTLGMGAMGTVYKASHVRLSRKFAIKVLHPQLTSDPKMAARFEREASMAALLRHPNLVGIVDVGVSEDSRRYMVMDLAVGKPLLELLAEAPLPAERIIGLVRQMLDGLHHAHEAGLIHRDLKPENVIVEIDDFGREVPRIVDFGIAILRDGADDSSDGGRLTTEGLVLGTPQYMAPEQACGDPLDAGVDLFAMGVIVYFMLCGTLPFEGTGVEIARANIVLDPPRIAERVPGLSVDPLLETFARNLMAKRRVDRPSSARAAREILDLIERDRRAASARLKPQANVQPQSTNQPQRTEPEVAHAPTQLASTAEITGNVVRTAAPRTSRTTSLAIAIAIAAAAFAVVVGLSRCPTTDDALSAAPAPDARATEPSPDTHVAAIAHLSSIGVTNEPTTRNEPTTAPERPTIAAPRHTEPTPTVRTTPEATHDAPRVPAPPITPANFRERYAAVQRALKGRGTNEMWNQFLRIDVNMALSFPDKQREAFAILAQIEALLARR